MPVIKDFEGYLKRMQNGMDDKLWWVDKVDSKIIVDYGCADGTLLKHIRELHPDYTLVGVDVLPEMLERAYKNVPDAHFITAQEFLNAPVFNTNATLILSSVIHEIYSYCPDAENIMRRLLSMGFDHIAIRDMFISENTEKETIPYELYKKLCEHTDANMIYDFSKYYGYPVTQQKFVHYLLKYRYVDNWEREVRENYLPINIEDFQKLVSEYYNIEYLEHYTLPFIKEQIKKDFEIVLDIPTHAKILLSKK